jgi:hypothetical protein
MPKSFLYCFSLNGSFAHASRSAGVNAHIVIETRDLDVAAAILHLRDHLRQHECRPATAPLNGRSAGRCCRAVV